MTTCKNCNTGFNVSREETELRDNISAILEAGPLPSPTHCPDCRMQRRMARRNERYLYFRTCDLSGKKIISVYPGNVPFPVFDRTEWWGDKWDPMQYGADFDFKKPFFEQFHALQNAVPRASTGAKNVENSDYSNFCFESKNCYLSHCSYRAEDLLYCYWLLECRDCMDCCYCFQCEKCFDCIDCNNCFNCRSCVLSNSCSDSYFLYDCRSCSECFGCVGLRHKSYCMFNEQLDKEEYQRRLQSYDLQNPEHEKKIRKKVGQLRLKHPHRYSVQDKTENCTGDHIFESKNCQNCFQIYRGEDSMHIADADDIKNCLDCYHPGWGIRSVYESYSPVTQQNSAFLSQCWDGSDNFYCDTCIGTSNCFGCIGLKRKKYCILNKQYSKEEYFRIMPKIVEHMKKTNEWGEYFPIRISPFSYNETMAQEFYPLTKEEVVFRGYGWKDPDPKEMLPQIYEVPLRIEETRDVILKEILVCCDCGKNYRVIAQELALYREKKIAPPRQCPDCRYKLRQRERNLHRLYDRACAKCNVAIRTTYAPERPEIVYCDKCYLKEVY